MAAAASGGAGGAGGHGPALGPDAAGIPPLDELRRRLASVRDPGVRKSIRKLAVAVTDGLSLDSAMQAATEDDWQLFGWFLARNRVVKKLT